jgi:hypothetical protein
LQGVPDAFFTHFKVLMENQELPKDVRFNLISYFFHERNHTENIFLKLIQSNSSTFFNDFIGLLIKESKGIISFEEIFQILSKVVFNHFRYPLDWKIYKSTISFQDQIHFIDFIIRHHHQNDILITKDKIHVCIHYILEENKQKMKKVYSLQESREKSLKSLIQQSLNHIEIDKVIHCCEKLNL